MTGCIFCQKQDDASGLNVYSQCKILHGKPCPPCAEYTSLEEEIMKMRQTLRKKLARRRELREKINLLHDRVVNRIPPEITTHVFELAVSVDDQPAGGLPVREGEQYAPLILGSVCRAWRKAAWSMPQLWTFIDIHIPTGEDLPTRLDTAKRWLSRSGNYRPLSIHLLTHVPCDPGDFMTPDEAYSLDKDFTDILEPLIELLCHYAGRCQVLSVTLPPRAIQLLFDNYHGKSTLRTLHLSATRHPLASTCSDIFSRQSGPMLPSKLNSVLLKDISSSWMTTVGTVTLESMFVHDILSILCDMPALVSLTLCKTSGHWEKGLGWPHGQLTHFNIQTFRLSTGLCDTIAFLATLKLPALIDLSIDLIDQDPGGVLRLLTALIRRSSCVLVSVSLSNVPDALDEVIEFIECLDSVKNLEIRGPGRDCFGRVEECYFLRALLHILQEPNNESKAPPLSNLHRLTYFLLPNDTINPWFILTNVSHPKWRQSFPRWESLTITHDPRSPEYLKDPANRTLMMGCCSKETCRRVLTLIDSGVKFFLPFRITGGDVADLITGHTQNLSDISNMLAALQI